MSQHDRDIIVISSSDSEDGSRSRSAGRVVLASVPPTQPGARPPNVIEVVSDGSEDELDRYPSPLLKRPRTGQYRVISPTTASGSPADSDPEREYDTLHHGLDPGSTNNWKAIIGPSSSQVPQQDITAQLPTTCPSRTSKLVRGKAVEPECIPPPPSVARRKDFIWVTAAALLCPKPSPTKLLKRKKNHFGHQPSVVLGLAPVSALFAKAGGAINKVIQQPGCIAISSAVSGGQPDIQGTEQPIDPYNHEGTLQFWQESKVQSSMILHGHCHQSEMPTCHKCYTVNSISFDPNQSQIMASAGNNGTVQLWLDGKKLASACFKYPRVPHDVVYRKKDSLLAVSCMNGCAYVHSTQSGLLFGDPIDLCVVQPDVQHSVGSLIWGHDASADMLFASSEAQRADDYSGYHMAFDPDQRRRLYDFSAKGNGDAMALDSDGSRLALCTVGPERGVHSLQLYDVRRRDGRNPIQHVRLDSFEPKSGSSDGEVTTTGFSPDGVMLAVTRSDDELHIYDSRFLGNSGEPMVRYLHWEDDCCVGDKWGVVDAVWVDGWCGRGFGVVTGGSDGCVRFWDTRKSGEDLQNGEVLARPNVDIGHFSVGDPRRGEKPLVVGDNGGRVYVYDYASACKSDL